MPNKTDFFDYEPVRPSQSRTREEKLDPHDWISPSSDRRQHPEDARQRTLDPSLAPLDARAPVSAPRQNVGQPALVRLLKRGHTLTFLGLFLFTVVLYFRPYELFATLSSFKSLAFWLAIATLVIFIPSQFGLEGNLTWRPREVNLVLLLALAGLISIGTAIKPSEAWNEFNDVFIKAVLMFIVMVNVVRSEARLRALLYVALAVTFLLAFNAISDYRSGNFTVEGYRINGLLGGMFGNPNDLALHFVTMAPLAVGLMVASRRLIGKLVFGITTLMIVAANVVTYSRGGFIGLLVTGIVLAWRFGRKNRIAVAIVGPLILGLFVLFAPGNYGTRILSIFIPSLDPVGSSSSREVILNRSIIVSLRNFLTGIGMGNFHTVSLHETVTHNAFTQVSAEMGYAALIIYLMFLTGPIRSLSRIERETFRSKEKRRYHVLAIALNASLIGYMVSAFFAAVAYQWYAFYLVGYAVCLRRMYYAETAATELVPIAQITAQPMSRPALV